MTGMIDDVATGRNLALLQEGRRLVRAQLLRVDGYRPEARFNAPHGDRRMLFHGPLGERVPWYVLPDEVH